MSESAERGLLHGQGEASHFGQIVPHGSAVEYLLQQVEHLRTADSTGGTPVGGGIRSLNVALRQELDLYVCLRPIQYFDGVPSPVKEPHKTDMVIFRENSEDIYAGIEFEAESEKAKKLKIGRASCRERV